MKNIVIIGGSGALGSAFVKLFSAQAEHTVYSYSRAETNFAEANVIAHYINTDDEGSIAEAVDALPAEVEIDMLLVCTGILHEGEMMPEKSIAEIDKAKMQRLYEVNTIGPTIVVKHFLPKMRKKSGAVIGLISARLSSISDNRIGGWH